MKLKYLKNVTSLSMDQNKCVGCGKCLDVCPHQVFSLCNRKVQIVERDACMECGACQVNCVANAIHVQAGVGCAYAVVNGFLKKTDPNCGCGSSDDGGSSCC